MSNHVRVVVILDVHDQRVAFPAAARVAHPEVDALRCRRAVRVDRAMDLRPLERHRDVIGRLEDLERELHVHDARHAGHVALRQRIGGQRDSGAFSIFFFAAHG